jgi:hypothetical protein
MYVTNEFAYLLVSMVIYYSSSFMYVFLQVIIYCIVFVLVMVQNAKLQITMNSVTPKTKNLFHLLCIIYVCYIFHYARSKVSAVLEINYFLFWVITWREIN